MKSGEEEKAAVPVMRSPPLLSADPAVDKCPGSAITLPRTALTWRGAPLVDGTANWGFPRVDAVYETAVPSVLWDTAPARRGGEGVVVKPGAGRGDRSGR